MQEYQKHFSVEEFDKLKEKFGPDATIRKVELHVSKKFFSDFAQRISTDRRAEVSFAVQRKNGKWITVQGENYPKGTFRIPTGGVAFGESVYSALFREVAEELGLKTEIVKFLGCIEYTIVCEGARLLFYSFGFWLRELDGALLTDATEDEIYAVSEMDRDELVERINALRETEQDWSDWCRFRMESTSLIISFV